MFFISGILNGKKVYWRKWTGDCSAGRPKWVEKFSFKCLFNNKKIAEKTLSGKGSSHFLTEWFDDDDSFIKITNVKIESYAVQDDQPVLKSAGAQSRVLNI